MCLNRLPAIRGKETTLTQTLEALNAFLYLFTVCVGCRALMLDRCLFEAGAAPCRFMDVLALKPHHSLKKALL